MLALVFVARRRRQVSADDVCNLFAGADEIGGVIADLLVRGGRFLVEVDVLQTRPSIPILLIDKNLERVFERICTRLIRVLVLVDLILVVAIEHRLCVVASRRIHAKMNVDRQGAPVLHADRAEIDRQIIPIIFRVLVVVFQIVDVVERLRLRIVSYQLLVEILQEHRAEVLKLHRLRGREVSVLRVRIDFNVQNAGRKIASHFFRVGKPGHGSACQQAEDQNQRERRQDDPLFIGFHVFSSFFSDYGGAVTHKFLPDYLNDTAGFYECQEKFIRFLSFNCIKP